MIFNCTFKGRVSGDIGITCRIETTIEADDVESAKRELWERFEHISWLVITQADR